MTESHSSPQGEWISAADLLPKVYAELRALAATLTSQLQPGQTLQPTALVHEAYLRLVRGQDPAWEGPRHFFGAAARAMPQILIATAPRKSGGGGGRGDLPEGRVVIDPPAEDVLALDEAVRQLQENAPRLAEIVMLRYYTGLSIEETAEVIGTSLSTVKRDWRFARA